jgi:16S rRNA (cytosine1402-N4)-methyltransferase
MPTEHEPVLASELTALLAPKPGQVAVDCTFGGGGHARRIAAALGPGGTLIAIDRDPAAEARFERFAAEVECETRFLGADF